MKFKGNGIIWDADNNCALCKFEDHELVTEDERVIEILKENGFEFEESKDSTPSITVKELKALLDEKGIEYDAKAKKEDLVKLLEGAE